MWNAIKSMGLGTRIVLLTMAVLLPVVTVNYVIFVRGYEQSAEKAMIEKAAAFTAVADEAKNHIGALNRNNAFDMNELINDLKKNVAAGKPYSETRVFGTIPVVAGWTAAREAASRERIEFRVPAFEARNKTNLPEPGSFREKLLRDLETQVASNGPEVIHRVDPANNELHYMRAIRLTAQCLMCHGDPATSPSKDGKDVLGFAMENWQVGKMHGAYEVVMPMAPVKAQVGSFITNGLMWTVPLILAAVGFFIWMLRLMFNRPIAALIERVKDIAQGEGDLTKRIEVKSKDEIGQLGGWINTFVSRIHDVILDVSSSANEVASAATQIAASGEEMSGGMNEQTQQVTQISSAIEEMSASVVEVAKKSGDAAASAVESGKVAEEGGKVVAQTIEGMQGINQAVSASAASVQELGKRGEQIGQIIEVINDIADQTNLLALNAAIEAARAGEHGRGFAVVADEVRKLADRTTKATEEIAGSIKAIQTETSQAVERMNAGSEQVKTGVERATRAGQSLQEIVTKAKSVASMIQSIAAAAEQQSAASEQGSRNVESISAVTKQTSEGASQAAAAATELSRKAEQLKRLVSQFKLDGAVQRSGESASKQPPRTPAAQGRKAA